MRYKVECEDTDGWTRWVQPRATGYYMKCCDCGLVHVMQFRVRSKQAQFRARRVKRRARA